MAGNRGFAKMDRAKQKEIASKGGKRAHELGKAYKWNSETAKIAGRLGAKKARENALRRKQAAEQTAQVIGDGDGHVKLQPTAEGDARVPESE